MIDVALKNLKNKRKISLFQSQLFLNKKKENEIVM
jgi:hypothetical protein